VSGPVSQEERVSGAVADRIAGIVLVILAVGAWWHSHTFTTGFGQPVGPGAFPRLVSVPLGLVSLYLILRPGLNQRWPQGSALMRQVGALVLLAVYATFIEPWGFLPASLITVPLLMQLFGASWKASLVNGTLLTVALYLLFEFVLRLPLPNMPGLNW
jgi:putative tricarboxylic transport membrane protein